MSIENVAATGSEKVRKRKKLTAAEKWQVFLETSAKDAPVGEMRFKNIKTKWRIVSDRSRL